MVFDELSPPPKTHACPANPNVQITPVSAHICQNPWGPPHGFLPKPEFLQGFCRLGPTAKNARMPRKPKCANYLSFGTCLPKSLGSPPRLFDETCIFTWRLPCYTSVTTFIHLFPITFPRNPTNHQMLRKPFCNIVSAAKSSCNAVSAAKSSCNAVSARKIVL